MKPDIDGIPYLPRDDDNIRRLTLAYHGTFQEKLRTVAIAPRSALSSSIMHQYLIDFLYLRIPLVPSTLVPPNLDRERLRWPGPLTPGPVPRSVLPVGATAGRTVVSPPTVGSLSPVYSR